MTRPEHQAHQNLDSALTCVFPFLFTAVCKSSLRCVNQAVTWTELFISPRVTAHIPLLAGGAMWSSSSFPPALFLSPLPSLSSIPADPEQWSWRCLMASPLAWFPFPATHLASSLIPPGFDVSCPSQTHYDVAHFTFPLLVRPSVLSFALICNKLN